MWQKLIMTACMATAAGTFGIAPAHAARPGHWTQINDPGEGREEATVTLLQDGRVLIAGGEGYQGVLTLVEVFDPKTNTYKTGRSLHAPRDQATATLLPNGNVLVVGGTSDNVNPVPLTSAEIYNPKTRKWTLTGSMNQARFGHEATLLQDGRVLVMGGTPDVENQLTSCEIWDPATGQWTFTGAMNYGRRYSSAVTLPNGNVLEAGDDVRSELYSVATGTWSLTKPEPDYIFGTPLVLLKDGTVLAPPSETDAHTGAGETYDPATNAWKATRPAVGRTYPANTLLRDGSVLVAGGCTDSCSVQSVNSVVRYIPARRAYVNAAPMNVGRERAVAVTLQDGRVLMQGGFAASGPAAPEVFTP